MANEWRVLKEGDRWTVLMAGILIEWNSRKCFKSKKKSSDGGCDGGWSWRRC